jgi:prepilin-type N-terminal cleavage/methylation domain-containing protein
MKKSVIRSSNIPIFQYSARKGGFTLIELLVVLVILVIVIGVSVTSIPSFASPKQKLRSDARELLSLLQESRQTAMLRKMKIDICVDPENGTVCAIETARSRRLAAIGKSLFDADAVNTNGYFRTVSFGEDIELGVFPADAIKTVLTDEDDPFAKAATLDAVSTEAVAFTFTHFGGASGGGISLVRENARLDIACDILTGEPDVVALY